LTVFGGGAVTRDAARRRRPSTGGSRVGSAGLTAAELQTLSPLVAMMVVTPPVMMVTPLRASVPSVMIVGPVPAMVSIGMVAVIGRAPAPSVEVPSPAAAIAHLDQRRISKMNRHRRHRADLGREGKSRAQGGDRRQSKFSKHRISPLSSLRRRNEVCPEQVPSRPSNIVAREKERDRPPAKASAAGKVDRTCRRGPGVGGRMAITRRETRAFTSLTGSAAND
jgi:hypothetical protein